MKPPSGTSPGAGGPVSIRPEAACSSGHSAPPADACAAYRLLQNLNTPAAAGVFLFGSRETQSTFVMYL